MGREEVGKLAAMVAIGQFVDLKENILERNKKWVVMHRVRN